jgi:hypothetical protein
MKMLNVQKSVGIKRTNTFMHIFGIPLLGN